MPSRSVHKWVGALLFGWYLLLPHRDEGGTPGMNQPTTFAKWQRVGSYDSALGCELARQARIVRDRTLVMTAVCVVSDEPRRSGRPAPAPPDTPRAEPGVLLDTSAGDQ